MPPVLYRERLAEVYPQLKRVKLIGGEPTIMRNCRETAELLRLHPQVKLGITTNGVKVDSFWHDTFVHQGHSVNFSINAATEATYNKIVKYGDFRSALLNVERVLSNRMGKLPHTSISAVIFGDNVHEIAQFVRLGHSLGVDEVVFMMDPILSYKSDLARETILTEVHNAKNAQSMTGMRVAGLQTFERGLGFHSAPPEPPMGHAKRLELRMCSFPFNNVVIDWDGSVRVCCNTWVKIGNLYDSSLADILTGAKRTKFQEKVRSGNYSWCNQYCEDNPQPTRLALLHKAWHGFCENPRQFLTRIQHKRAQLLSQRGSAQQEDTVKRPKGSDL